MKYIPAILCAGQGAQTVGMGRDLAEAFPECKTLFTKANEILGYDLQKIIFEGPESELTRSNHCQPAIFIATAACFQALKQEMLIKSGRAQQPVAPSSCHSYGRTGSPALPNEISIKAVAGLSLGEWSALHLAGALSFEDGLRILEARGRYMQLSCEENEGAMLSIIGLENSKLQEIALASGVEIANYNSPEQTVLSGRKQNILEAEKMAKALGAKRAIMLNVAGAYHSSLMKSAGDKMQTFLSGIKINPAKFPVMSNVTGQPHNSPDDIKQNMVRQITSSVRWVDCMQTMSGMGVNCFVECGPGRVLSGLVKRIQPQAQLCNVQDKQSLKTTADLLTK